MVVDVVDEKLGRSKIGGNPDCLCGFARALLFFSLPFFFFLFNNLREREV
jgi:hypothetical protein